MSLGNNLLREVLVGKVAAVDHLHGLLENLPASKRQNRINFVILRGSFCHAALENRDVAGLVANTIKYLALPNFFRRLYLRDLVLCLE